MQVSARLLASVAKSLQAHPFRPPPVALLPPIPLYRRILRTHRTKLPGDMRLLGDKYVKDEFRRHQKIDNPIHIVGFLTQWQDYAQQLEGDTWREEKLDKAMVDKMSACCRIGDTVVDIRPDQQIGQLYELMQAIRQKELGIEKATDSENVIEVDKKP